MKLAISVAGESLDSPYDPRFGRAAAFCIIDLESDAWQVIANPGVTASGGAGVQAAQFIASQEVQTVISGAFGPKAFEALKAAGIEMLVPTPRDALPAADVLTLYKEGSLKTLTAPSRQGGHGGRH